MLIWCQFCLIHLLNEIYFIFGHFHIPVDMQLEGGSRLLLLEDWKNGSSYLYFDGKSLCSGHSRNIEK